MAGGIIVRTTGFKEADRIFRKLKLDVKEKELRKGHRSAGRLLVKAEREGFRGVARNRTGATERSIGIINERAHSELGVVAVGPRITRNRENSGYKAWWFEKGTVKMTARPFVKPAIDRTEAKMRDEVGIKLKKTLERTARRNRKL